ncbi:hypothetical protein HHI36_005432 [Cryptolaemus montrouzieri]|uniref:Uncharacterized protein n=1 Tax=Cryptolaemus montrouzieri TaxID=559131 RepID=A0ABD2NU74_9CUCU
MEEDSGTPKSPLILHLSPRSTNTYNILTNDSENLYFSPDDINLLKKEIEMIKKQYSTDVVLYNAALNCSRSIESREKKGMEYKNNTVVDKLVIKTPKIDHRYPLQSYGPFLVLIESIIENNNLGNLHPMNLGKN